MLVHHNPPLPRSAAHAFDPATDRQWAAYELAVGEQVSGRILRLPQPGTFNGSRLFIGLEDGRVLGIHATAKRGHTVLERALADQKAQAGDRIRITYHGRRATADGEREYRLYQVVVA